MLQSTVITASVHISNTVCKIAIFFDDEIIMSVSILSEVSKFLAGDRLCGPQVFHQLQICWCFLFLTTKSRVQENAKKEKG